MWRRILKDARAPAMRVHEMDDLPEDPRLKAAGLVQDRVHPTEGAYVEVAAPVRFSGCDIPQPRPAPQLREHDAEIDRELGL